ncbi:SDR family oxidoreductase [Dongia rigui]|uniref:SDR family oxidoreductase n=1 Tax=Dongia rigui TaxID=940149 RepID=A0ABU5E3R2_9PROT|nr:SDR family oxidoreductase [Dongia rigui]MDY0873830.1 SDR family oxidoreductase [Dongia rigui]
MATPTGRKIIDGIKPGLRVFISAGASGIGRAIADMLILHGAKVFICDVAQGPLNDFQKEYPGHSAVLADVSSEGDMARVFADAKAVLGGLDGLINNAGVAGPTGAVEEIAIADWRRCIDVCLTGQFLCAHFAAPMLKEAGGGAIVNMSSVAGRHGYAFRTPYAAAKFGVIGLTQSLAKELGPHNIRVNAILPGIVEGPRMEAVIRARAEQLGLPYDEMAERYLEKVSLRRMVTPHDVAAMVTFLLSPMGDNLSGQSLGVDGNVETL